jgi:hypothetical protein
LYVCVAPELLKNQKVDQAPVKHVGRHIPAPDGVKKRQVIGSCIVYSHCHVLGSVLLCTTCTPVVGSARRFC